MGKWTKKEAVLTITILEIRDVFLSCSAFLKCHVGIPVVLISDKVDIGDVFQQPEMR